MWRPPTERLNPDFDVQRHTALTAGVMFFLDKDENANHAAEIVNGVYDADTVTGNYVQIWLRRFRLGICDVIDAPCTSRSVVKNVDKITEIIEVDRHVSSRSIAQELKIGHKIVLSHLRKVVFKQKFHVWVPPQLTPKNMMDRISICEALSKRNEIEQFLKGMKWPELANRRGVVFHQDNSRPHTSVVTRQNLWELGWEVLIHPPFSPDLTPSDYYPFRALQNFLSDKKLESREDCENRLLDVFTNKG
ncbi:putative DD34D transposase [Trichonephila clavipes]|nr:putative DD34D transposase [Trichonephila clavipes]